MRDSYPTPRDLCNLAERDSDQHLIKYVCTDCKHKWSSNWTDTCPKCGSDNVMHLPVVV